MDDIDAYVAAKIILTRYGPKTAVLYCAQQAEEMLKAGDVERHRVWQRIEDAVRELTRAPGEDDAVN